MCSELERQVTELKQGEHLCVLYESRAEQLAAVVPFIKEGLRRGERCVYIADDQTAEEVTTALAEAGVDVPAESGRGAFLLLTKRDTYLSSGAFDPEAMIDLLRQATEEALALGFAGLRATGEMTWQLGSGVSAETLLRYEALLNDFFPKSRALGLCQYNRARFPPAVLQGVLRTHPIAVLGEHVCPNLYYEPPELVLGPGASEQQLDWMVSQLKRGRAAEEALRRSNAHLVQDGRTKDEFLAALAHELRNPLAPVLNSLHIIRHSGGDLAVIDQARAVAERQAQHLARLVDDLLDISRITRGKVELRKEPVELTEAVTQAVDAVGPLIEARRHELSVLLPQRDIRLEADPTRLSQVLTNLLTNAAKYTNPGGRIWLTAEAMPGEVVLRVRDTGIGIPTEMLQYVFEPFVQVERSPGHTQGGLGIGLTLVRSLVGLHGGRAEALSEGPGKGSEFIVRLPVLPDVPARQPPGELPVGGASRGRVTRALVVDDNEDTAESLALLLRLWGHTVFVAHDGPEALEVARVHQPEVVLLDLGLPGMDGYEVARRLGGSDPRRPLLWAMTGYAQEEDRRRSKEAGFDQHLVKPVDPDALEMLLAQTEWHGRRATEPGQKSPSQAA